MKSSDYENFERAAKFILNIDVTPDEFLAIRQLMNVEAVSNVEGAGIIFSDASGGWAESVEVKPKTKEIYEKVEYKHAWEVMKLAEEGVELFKTKSDELQISRVSSIALRAQSGYDFYRKVEEPVDWRDEVLEVANEIGVGFKIFRDFDDCPVEFSTELVRDDFIKLARAALRATGELK